ncbi:CSE1 [Candida oxycetoniae]|uniref:CSE1 n=1 Tax=Candida oxycetoniae TaxID=497107 RepID=A0AAI9WZ53_9ASCO|nr:CSE1 [Candida oxycetoniae]KAI3405828.2 CSE1 [Candida oxycetoniae]
MSSQNSLETIPKILEQSLISQHSKLAEQTLRSIENEVGFSINLLHLVASKNLSASIRLAAALYFKNLVKRKWITEDGNNYLLPLEDVQKIKSEIVDIMLKLPSQLQLQIGEAITLIAECDFPHNWPNLVDTLVEKLSPTDFVTTKTILLVSHSIFKKWRPLVRSDDLFLEIKLVLEKFVEPFLHLFIQLDKLIDESKTNEAQLIIYLENMLLLMQIYYDFNCQDIPEFFEDHMNELMAIVYKYLNYDNSLVLKKDEDEEVDVLIKLKTSIIELLSLYVTRYADVFDPLIQTFITAVWDLINNFATRQSKFDLLVVKALNFLTSVVKIPNYQSIFQSESSVNEIIEKIILPNIMLRQSDEEMFEDEPILYVRSDLEGSDFDSRRKSATDILRELKELNSELLTTTVMKYVNQFLSLSASDWKNKDTAIYLFSSLATKGSVTNIGVTSTNVLVDVVDFFSKNVANDLESFDVHPILQVDAIKYIYTFRNQLTKEQLIATLPRLIKHLTAKSHVVVYTYAAITIEKLLSMTNFSQDHKPLFNKSDIASFVNESLTNLFNLILLNSNLSPEKLAENEFLVKCIMRILDTCKDSFNERTAIIDQLLQILKITAKNPSNPKFTHYIFESLGLLIKYGAQQDSKNINQYMEHIIPGLLSILSEDVQEFVPYSFQILAFLLENYPKSSGLPQTYKPLIQPLMSPSVWQFKGNIPGITRLLISIVEHDPSLFIDANHLTPLLGVFQNLLASKANDSYGFELIQSILLNIPMQSMQPFLNNIARLFLTRLQKSRTEKFVKKFVVFFSTLATANLSDDVQFINSGAVSGGDFEIQLVDSVQAGLFMQIFNSFMLPTSSALANLQDKKIVNIGLSVFLLNSTFITNYSTLVVPTIEKLVKNLTLYEGISKGNSTSTFGAGAGAGVGAGVGTSASSLGGISDFDSDFAVFGSNYSKIVSIANAPFDPLAKIKNNDYETIRSTIVSNIKKINVSFLQQLSAETQESLKQLGF